MEIHQLKYFLAIADYQSIAQASKHLHVSQSALSVALRDLERELGFPLFDRNKGRLHLNRNGCYMKTQIREALVLIDDARTMVSNHLGYEQKIVKCATNMTLGKISESMVRKYRRHRPDTILRIGFRGSPTFRNANPDLEFLGTEEHLETDDRTIMIVQERFMAAFSADSPLAAKSEVSLRDLRLEPYIMTGPGGMQDTIRGMFQEAGFSPNVVGEVQLYGEVLSLVRAGIGYSIVPEHSWMDNTQGLAVRPITDVKRHRNIYAQLPRQGVPSTVTLAFFDFLKAQASRLLEPTTAA